MWPTAPTASYCRRSPTAWRCGWPCCICSARSDGLRIGLTSSGQVSRSEGSDEADSDSGWASHRPFSEYGWCRRRLPGGRKSRRRWAVTSARRMRRSCSMPPATIVTPGSHRSARASAGAGTGRAGDSRHRRHGGGGGRILARCARCRTPIPLPTTRPRSGSLSARPNARARRGCIRSAQFRWARRGSSWRNSASWWVPVRWR